MVSGYSVDRHNQVFIYFFFNNNGEILQQKEEEENAVLPIYSLFFSVSIFSTHTLCYYFGHHLQKQWKPLNVITVMFYCNFLQ